MIIRLSHIDPEAVFEDIRKVAPDFETELPKGVSVIKLPPRLLEAGTYDDNGEELTPPVYGDEIRYDINIHPDYESEYQELTFETLVEPETPDHTIPKKYSL